MILKKILVENIKTHKETIIPFKKGLNVFHGDNGTGKSSILEMIGFVLFDYLRLKDHGIYVRETHDDKPEFGTVKIWLTGLNDAPYIVERTIGKTGAVLRDGLTNRVIPSITNVGTLKKWIITQLGLKKDVELEKIFETSVGIPQGTFIEPFLKRAGERKNYFDPILQIAIYDEIWNNLNQVKRKFEPIYHRVRENIRGIEGEIKRKSIVSKDQEGIIKDIEAFTDVLNKSKIEAEEIKDKFNAIKIVKRNFEEAKKKYDELEIRKEKEGEAITNLAIQLNESKQAKLICDKTEQAHKQFIDLSKNQNSLDEKFELLNAKRDELTKINEDYVKLEINMKQIRLQITEAEQSKEKVKELQPAVKKHEQIEMNIESLNEKITRIKTQEEALKKLTLNFNTLTSKNQQLGDNLKNFSVWQEKHKQLKKDEELEKALEIRISELQNEISFFQNNQDKIEKETCPFFNQTCKNLEEGTLDIEVFQQEILVKQDLLKTTKIEKKNLKEKLKTIGEVQEKLEQLKEDRIKLDESKKQIENFEKEINEISSKVGKLPQFLKEKKNLEQRKEELKKKMDNYHVHKNLIKKISPLNLTLKSLEMNLKKIKEKKAQYREVPKNMEQVKNLLRENKKQLKDLEPDHETYQKNINSAEMISTFRNRLQQANQQITDLKTTLDNTLQNLKKLERRLKEEDFVALEQKERDYDRKITELETQVKGKQERLQEITEELNEIEKKEEKLIGWKKKEDKYEVLMDFIERKLRLWIKEFIPKIRKAVIGKINTIASEIYRSIREEEDAVLKWKGDDYDIEITTSQSRKNFFRLSGGEKMAAALAVRLAILKVLTNAEFAFFDEPTTNLDPSARNNLSKYIYNIKGFQQLFVISHDDAFKRQSEYVVKFSKNKTETTQVSYLTK